ncbi:MAG: hypothetical protein MUC50_15370 [Myxococcota bacterium]|jgi:hypothetical protein|nr:hypothetical protein [Myxococcota bacterium]
MKKMIAVLLVSMFGFVFGCGGAPADPATPEAPTTDAPALDPAAPPAPDAPAPETME